MGVDMITFSPLLCIVSPWQENGDILAWLAYCDALGLPIVVDEQVCPGVPHEGLIFTAHLTDQIDFVWPEIPPR